MPIGGLSPLFKSIKTFHLPFQFPYTPVFQFALFGVKADFKFRIGLQNFKIMTPSQFVRQRLTFWKPYIKLPNHKKIASAKPLTIGIR